jgi:LmbE family N-acetylglucosaminyl deacetylase
LIVTDRILMVSAHPDDMEFLAGGTVARMVKEGSSVWEIIVTNGERGTLDLPRDELVERRQDEARKAASVLGLESVIFLEYPDGMLADFPQNQIRRRIMEQIRRLRVSTLITWDPFAPYETHPDHRITGMAATEAAAFANLPLYHPEQVQSEDDLVTVMNSYYIAKHHIDANEVIDTTAFVDLKIEALTCHQTQMEFMIKAAKKTLLLSGMARDQVDRVDPANYRELVDLAVRRRDSAIGGRIGVDYAEEFRLERADGFSALFQK